MTARQLLKDIDVCWTTEAAIMLIEAFKQEHYYDGYGEGYSDGYTASAES